MSEPVDFREQQGVYVLYDETTTMVYVGQTGNGDDRVFTRLRRHTSDHLSRRWSKFSWFGIRQLNQSLALRAEKAGATEDVTTVLNQIEAVLIAAAEPLLNRQGGRFGKADEYVQHRDVERLGLSLDQMIREIHERGTDRTGA